MSNDFWGRLRENARIKTCGDIVERLRSPTVFDTYDYLLEVTTKGATHIEKLESALKDVSKYIWRGDFHQLDQSTRETLDYVLGTQDESQ